MITPIISDKRPIINVNINNKEASMLVDTGSSLGIIDINSKDKFDFKLGSKLNIIVSGMGGTSDESVYHLKDCIVDIGGIQLYQFVTTDLSAIQESIKQNTGIKIDGIIGTTQIKMSEMKIDLDNKVIKILVTKIRKKYINPKYTPGGSEPKYLSLTLTGATGGTDSAIFNLDDLVAEGSISSELLQQIINAYQDNQLIQGSSDDSVVTGGNISFDGVNYTITIQDGDTVYELVVSSTGQVVSSTTSSVNNYTNADKTNLDNLSFYLGVNTVTTLVGLPVDKRSIVANITTAQDPSLSAALTPGRELYIRIYNNSGSPITQPIPNTGNFVSMNGTSVSIPAGSFIEMSIWAYADNSYSIRIGEVE